MEGSSSFGQQANISHPSDQRQDARFTVDSPSQYNVKVNFGHIELQAECLDYSPFGLGLRLVLSPDLPLFSIGELVDLECNFSGSRFRARGSVANTRVERTAEGNFVRLGIVLSRSAEVVRPAHVKRRSARIQMNESVSPLVRVSDELRFGDTIFAKMTDVSQGGMRLIIDRHPLPFLEKQRHWFEVILPVFGQCKTYCRIAYVRREDNSNRYVVGCEFIDGGGEDNISAVEDWLFYSNFWLSLADIRAAGFSLSHLSANDEKHRILLSASFKPTNSQHTAEGSGLSAGRDVVVENDDATERFELSLNHNEQVVRMTAALSARESILLIESVQSAKLQRESMLSIWKAILIFALTNHVVDIDVSAGDAEGDFFQGSLTVRKIDDGLMNLKVDRLMSGEELDWRIWRSIYKDLSRKNGFAIPKLSSLIRRFMVI